MHVALIDGLPILAGLQQLGNALVILALLFENEPLGTSVAVLVILVDLTVSIVKSGLKLVGTDYGRLQVLGSLPQITRFADFAVFLIEQHQAAVLRDVEANAGYAVIVILLNWVVLVGVVRQALETVVCILVVDTILYWTHLLAAHVGRGICLD